jgi:endonuclease/exonuclease/phosphatase (EEP) superfamily protein YafD
VSVKGRPGSCPPGEVLRSAPSSAGELPPNWMPMRQTVRFGWHAQRWVLGGLSWLVVAGLMLVTGFHLAHREPRSAIVGAIALTPWLYMLAWVTLSIGLGFRRRAMTAVSLVLVGLQMWWVLPDFDPFSHLVAQPPGSLSIRIFDTNVSQSNRNLTGIAAEISRDHPQIIAVEELTPASLASLKATGVTANYHFSLVRPTSGSYGMALWSVYPLADATEWFASGHPEMRAWVELPGGRRFRLDVLHTDAPYEGPDEPTIWADEIGAIRKELSREPRPLVAVGDLNATWYDWHFQALLSLHLRDAAVVAGQGWRMTWPRDQEPIVPYLRIDHALISPGISLESYGLGDGQGSDHHPLIVQIALHLPPVGLTPEMRTQRSARAPTPSSR